MREIGTTAGFLEIGDTFRTVGAPIESGFLVVRDVATIHNRESEKLYWCIGDSGGDAPSQYRVVLKNGTPIVLRLGGISDSE